jgi:hypothetical protein
VRLARVIVLKMGFPFCDPENGCPEVKYQGIDMASESHELDLTAGKL